MKALHERTQNLQAESLAAGLAARIAGIFEQYPILCGFSVQERSTLTKERAIVQLQGELGLADVSVRTWAGFQAPPGFYVERASSLRGLTAERPEAVEVLTGCTFARTLH